MAYRQYTKCVSPNNYIGKMAGQVIIGAAIAALPILFGASFVPGVALIVLGGIIAYCRWWLYDRLICLGGDVCAIGWVVTVEPPEKKSGLDAFDTDFSFNLALYPHLEGATRSKVESDGVQGNLIKKQQPIIDQNLKFVGYEAGLWSNRPKTAVLHCEFEGGGVYDLLLAALAAFAFAAAAAVVCVIPVIGWIACAILQIIAGAIMLVGLIVALNDKGNPNDVNANLGELHVNDATGRGADILVVKGTWVFDSAHDGYNEIHPIKHCQRIGTWNGTWQFGGTDFIRHWCEAIDASSSAVTVNNQAAPENQWTVHPVIDGCEGNENGDTVIK